MSVRDLIILGCASQQPTRLRNQGGYLLRWNTEGFLFDPGEGTQRQFIFAEVSPTAVTRIFISHFHGDHCLGLGSMIMRLNLDGVTRPIHCYFPKSGMAYFDRLCTGTIFNNRTTIVKHPISENGVVEEDDNFTIEAAFLDHGVDNIGWRITEKNRQRFFKEKLAEKGIRGPNVKELIQKGQIEIDGKITYAKDVSYTQEGSIFSYVVDTRPCAAAIKLAQDADLVLCESTYLTAQEDLAHDHYHMTAKQAALIAKTAGAKNLVLTHFSARYLDLEPFVTEAKKEFANVDVADDFKRFVMPKRKMH
ncbi:ribonuclease Z [Candidatus Aerophobetes bacterium]|uniref:Ribonuclease Z n=1 Tax=Aerophobetes bacterium TaxID=2030807 RepID=A0A2A4X749_UNCAE|nr:MAG: ribonuclease Z [Candidatus Aerophobetes bacterium]